MSSGENVGAVDDEPRGARASSRMEVLIWTLAGGRAVDVEGSEVNRGTR